MTGLFARLLFSAARLATGARVEGAPASHPAIYFAHHTSHLDTLVILSAMPAHVRASVHPVAARDYWGATRLRRFVAARCLNAVLIDRAPAPGQDALEGVAARLEQGHSVILFPEGTRSQDGISGFKSGLHRLALRFPEATLIPVQLHNVQRVLPKGARLPVPLACEVRFGAALALLPGETRDEFLGRARRAVTPAPREAHAGAFSAQEAMS